VLDFVRLVKQRHGLPAAPPVVPGAVATGDSAFFQALEAVGFVGVIDTNEQLSTAYKNRLDFRPNAVPVHDSGRYGSIAGPVRLAHCGQIKKILERTITS
jgi:hypothetical protein